MKKTYISPNAKTIELRFEGLIAQSVGVKAGASLGNEYNSDDESYSNRRNSIWGDE